MRNVLVALPLSALLAAHGASAFAYTGNELFADCGQDRRSAAYGRCVGFVEGILVGAVYGGAYEVGKTGSGSTVYRPFCVADGVTIGQLADIVAKYLGENPKDRHRDAAVLIIQAVLQNFSCR